MGLFKRKDSPYYYIGIYWRGVYYKESTKTTSKRAARQREYAMLNEIQRNEYVPRALGKMKLLELVDLYLQYSKTKKRSYIRDCGLTKNLLEYFGPEADVTKIKPLEIEQYQGKRKDEGRALRTINREVACLKAMYNKGIAWGRLKENPAARVRLFKEQNTKVRFLTGEEIKKLLDVSAPYLRNIIIFALNTGMRKKEIMHLEWQDVDLVTKIINVKDTKSGEDRKIPVNTVLNTLLNALERPYARVFLGREGREVENIRMAFKTALKRAVIENFRFHDLRHTFASQLVMSGVDIKSVMELLGHKSLEMTTRYAHLSPSHKSAAVEKMTKFFESNLPTSTPSGVGEKGGF